MVLQDYGASESWYFGIMGILDHGTLETWFLGPCDCGNIALKTMGLWENVPMGLWGHVTLEPWDDAILGPWNFGTIYEPFWPLLSC